MRNILIITTHSLYLYEQNIIDEISRCIGCSINYLVMEIKRTSPKRNTMLALIDRRFCRLRQNPYETVQATAFFRKNHESFNSADISSKIYSYVILLGVDRIPEKIQFKKALKPEINEKLWFEETILRRKYTTLNLIAADQTTDWHIVRQISVKTEKGIYNNHNKALFHLRYLFNAFFLTKNYLSHYKPVKHYNRRNIYRYYSFLTRLLFERKINKKHQNWKIAFIRGEITEMINQPPNTFWADPFCINEGDDMWVFFEEMEENQKGKISACKINGSEVTEKKTVLEQPFHLSFPNVFRKNGKYYMLPEQSESGRLDLYTADRPGGVWEYHSTLIPNIRALDPVWIYHDGKYWLFFNKIEDFEYDNNERIYIYYSDDLFSTNWKPHRQNPVIINISKSRNAGSIFEKDGYLYRPSQNCEISYGAEVILNKITKLTEDEYEEVKSGSLNHLNNWLGMHTYNQCEGTYVTDFLVEE